MLKSLFARRPADLVKEFFGSRYMLLVNYSTKHRRQWMDQVTRLHADRRLLLNHCEACQLISAVKATAHVPGQIAELGVAYGGSAKLIAKHSGNRKIHLFDTFAGLPEPTEGDSAKFSGGDFMTSIQEVQNYLRDVDRQQFVYHKGYFPETAAPLTNDSFSFVHLDADLYNSTLSALQFFYPRMSPGGIILCHDFTSADGVDRALEEFFAGKPEPVIELSGYQCLIVKL